MKYKLLGKEEGFAICDFCGKKEISILHHVIDSETGAEFVFGSSCIIKALKITSDEFRAMTATKELEELEASIAHFNLTISDELYYGDKCKRAYLTFGGIRYTRLMARATEKEVATKYGYWIDCATGKYALLGETKSSLLAYFRNKKRLEATIKKIETLNP